MSVCQAIFQLIISFAAPVTECVSNYISTELYHLPPPVTECVSNYISTELYHLPPPVIAGVKNLEVLVLKGIGAELIHCGS